MTTKDAIIFGLRRSGNMLGMFTGDLSRQDLHHRIVPAANPAAWIVGHLILSERHALQMLGITPESMPKLPFDDFEKRFAREEAATTSQDFGEPEILPRIFQDHRNALISAVEATDEADFDKPLPQPMRIAGTVGELLLFWPMHVAMHLGQISALRRSLGRPPLV